MSRFKLVILDFDGTLCDSNNLIVNTMQATIQELGLEYRSREACSKMIGLPLNQCFTDLIPMSEEMGDKCADTYRRIFDENNVPGSVPPFPGVIETIRQLHQEGVAVTIASSRSNRSLMEFVEELHLNDYISYVLGSDDVIHAKPDPEPVLKTLEHYQIDAKDTLVVGDTEFDIKMGVGAGAITCGVTYGNGSIEELQSAGADYIVDSFSDILKL